MKLNLFLFEWRYFTRQPSFYITGLIFFILGFLGPSAGMSALGNVLKNGPYAITFLMLFVGIFSMFLVVNFVANAALRDHSSEMSELLFSKPVNALTYQLCRFCGAYLVVVSIYFMLPVGHMLGSLMPWLDASRIGPVDPRYYLNIFIIFSLPTLFLLSCLFYAVAVRFRSMMAVYLALIFVFICYEASSALLSNPQSRDWAALLDPFALATFDQATRYWTIEQKNTQLVSLSGMILYNRALWLTIGLVVIAIFGRFCRPLSLTNTTGKIFTQNKLTTNNTGATHLNNRINFQGQNKAGMQQFLTCVRFEIRQVLVDRGFLILCTLTLISVLSVMFEPAGIFGNAYWPVTQTMVELISKALAILSLIIITYYSAEMVWRERSVNITDVVGHLPVSNACLWFSKLITLCLILLILVALSMMLTILVQLSSGYEQIDLAQYLISLLYFKALPWMMLAVVAFLYQVLSPNKFVGMFVFALFLLTDHILNTMGYRHNLYHFSHSPALIYSDMNGYGQSLLKHTWYMLYWGSLTTVLSILGYALWHRGPQQNLKTRWRLLPSQMSRQSTWLACSCLLVFTISGGVIYHNTFILNDYFTQSQIDTMHVDYEKRYFSFGDNAVPSIVSINAAVDIYPFQHKLLIDTKLILRNNSDTPIKRFLVTLPGYNPILADRAGYSKVDFSLEIKGGTLGQQDGPLNTHWFEFDQPMLPNEERNARFSSTRDQKGFSEQAPTLNIINNGTFIQNNEIFPRFGYLPELALQDAQGRAKAGLSVLQRAHDLHDPQYQQQSILGHNGGYLTFETTVSTSVDQTAFAPGYLQDQWLDNNRRYFHYKMDNPIDNYFAYFSGRYEKLETTHNNINVGVYYHDQHKMNVQRIAEAIKDSLDYYGSNFAPYQHKQARVIEFPGPKNFGQDFPNTIAYSERSGFIHDQRNPGDADQVYWFIAHEMAHQWWGAQLNAANVQGATMLIETLAQYSAFMLIKNKYGPDKLRQMLKYELDRYLNGRSRETIAEQPLMRVEDQAYIHYNKGSIAMMAVANTLGEERLNVALKGLLTKFRFDQNNYPTTLDLLSFVNQQASLTQQAYIDRLFNQINIYDFALRDSQVILLDNNQYQVTLTIEAKRTQANESGTQKEVTLEEMVDIGLFLQHPDQPMADQTRELSGEHTYVSKHKLFSGENKIVLQLPFKPVVVILDPYIEFIDRDIGNNESTL